MSQEFSANALLTGAQVFQGSKAIQKNADAVMWIYNSIKTSYGPYGLDKMCVDASGSVSITNDGASILKNMLVDDPAARLMVNLALEQDKEVGDGTTSVVILASNLIKKGQEIISEGVHPSTVVSGYRLAFNESMKYIKERVSRKVNITDSNMIRNIVDTCISSKIIYGEKELFTSIAQSCLECVSENGRYEVDRVNILKSIGGSMGESQFFDGYILNCSVASQLMAKRLKNPKITCLDLSLLKEKLPLTVNIQVTDPEKLEQIRAEEIGMTRRKCQAIIDSGATLVLCTGGIDEMCIKMFIDNGVIAVRRVDGDDLTSIAMASGTEVRKSIVDENNEYRIDSLGSCEEFEVRAIGEYELCYFSGFSNKLPTVLIRGPNAQIVDEVQRSLNDAIQILKRTLESRSVVPGGGAVECALSFLLEDFSTKVNIKEHVAVYKYAEAILEIPKILATNAGLDASVLVSKMLGMQFEQYEQGNFDKFFGLDVVKGDVQENFVNGILEPTVYKLKALKAATEAAISVLRINEIVVFPSNQ
ncbi:T-complex protein 1, alpha subunit [Vittaforma corneae ATCC 50505]|uniref:T-complex protein 1, alpha subunit n=1 Tax=Vittaforma corneae (strain ATCC 50505) TaxID=993615 RepID=L2GNK9_VITCO|nr:T-complex protein 1, alpha subunit [Vittaforma corneae ATCC 50505]ELA42194.1 T-complex protein 1, alpha subunit [Vittaforma corneae ATCC 50505]